MDEETRERVFEPFFTTKEAGKGTGLGLATAYAIVDQHRGWIEVESQPNQGTAIVVYLPAKKITPRRARKIAATPILGGTETILVIDDEEDIRKLLAITLRRYGYKVLLGRDGEDGVAQFMRHRGDISLVLLDLLMPQLSGKATLARLLTIDPDLKVVISTGLSNEDMRAAGAKAVLYKPYQENAVLEKVRQVLDA
jgi:CheY-like chemotaxis protein